MRVAKWEEAWIKRLPLLLLNTETTLGTTEKNRGIIETMVKYCTANSPLPEALTAWEVGTTAAFLASPLASGITAATVYVDKGYHAMGMAVAMPPGTELLSR